MEISQVWAFMRSYVSHLKHQVLAIRPECVPSIRPSTIHFIEKCAKDVDHGGRAKKEFLVSIPKTGDVITKVIINTSKLPFISGYLVQSST